MAIPESVVAAHGGAAVDNLAGVAQNASRVQAPMTMLEPLNNMDAVLQRLTPRQRALTVKMIIAAMGRPPVS